MCQRHMIHTPHHTDPHFFLIWTPGFSETQSGWWLIGRLVKDSRFKFKSKLLESRVRVSLLSDSKLDNRLYIERIRAWSILWVTWETRVASRFYMQESRFYISESRLGVGLASEWLEKPSLPLGPELAWELPSSTLLSSILILNIIIIIIAVVIFKIFIIHVIILVIMTVTFQNYLFYIVVVLSIVCNRSSAFLPECIFC